MLATKSHIGLALSVLAIIVGGKPIAIGAKRRAG